MEDWQHLGLIVRQNRNYDNSSREISSVMSKNLPDFKTQEIKLKVNGKGHTQINKEKLERLLIQELIKNEDKKLLTVIGHGVYHHLVYTLCRYADKISKKYSYIHIDRHCDSWRTPEEALLGELNCANFVPFILEDTNAQNVLYLGSNIIEEDLETFDNDLLLLKYEKSKFVKENVSGFFKEEKLERLIDSLEDDVYISMDLDVMDSSEVVTGFERGRLTKIGLFDALSMIKRKKRIIGADIVGYSSSFDDIRKSFENDPYAGISELWLTFNGVLKPSPELKRKEEVLTSVYEKEIRKLKEKSFRLYQDIALFITK